MYNVQQQNVSLIFGHDISRCFKANTISSLTFRYSPSSRISRSIREVKNPRPMSIQTCARGRRRLSSSRRRTQHRFRPSTADPRSPRPSLGLLAPAFCRSQRWRSPERRVVWPCVWLSSGE